MGSGKRHQANQWPSRKTEPAANQVRQVAHVGHLKSAPLLPTLDDGSLAMQLCTFNELDDSRCHCPIGDIEVVSTEFCGFRCGAWSAILRASSTEGAIKIGQVAKSYFDAGAQRIAGADESERRAAEGGP